MCKRYSEVRFTLNLLTKLVCSTTKPQFHLDKVMTFLATSMIRKEKRMVAKDKVKVREAVVPTLKESTGEATFSLQQETQVNQQLLTTMKRIRTTTRKGNLLTKLNQSTSAKSESGRETSAKRKLSTVYSLRMKQS